MSIFESISELDKLKLTL